MSVTNTTERGLEAIDMDSYRVENAMTRPAARTVAMIHLRHTVASRKLYQ